MPAAAPRSPPLLEVRGLRVTLGRPPVEAVRGIDFQIQAGGITGLAGESGSGKSVAALALTRLLPPQAQPVCAGEVRLRGAPGNLLALGSGELRRIRGRRIGYLFQEPSASFNPVFTVGSQLDEVLRRRGVPRARRRREVRAVLEAVGLAATPEALRAWPGDLSGGMLQRAALACVLLGEPELLVADEPTTALDTVSQRRIVDLLARLNRERGMAILFISHDLGLLRRIAGDLLVMRQGLIVEQGPARAVLAAPRHPYTRRLVEAVPKLRTG